MRFKLNKEYNVSYICEVEASSIEEAVKKCEDYVWEQDRCFLTGAYYEVEHGCLLEGGEITDEELLDKLYSYGI